MRWTLNLGKMFGVKIVLHWTFFLLLGWILFSEYNRGSSTETILLTAAYILAIFFCVVLHEMGHILTARHFGIDTRKITLLPIGGVASLDKIPEKPKEEFQVAIAGPLVNLAIAALIFPFLNDLASYIPSSSEAQQATASITLENFWFSLFTVNILLAVFNLIPAFPMDGGRILRSLLSMKMDRLKSTGIASAIGQFLSIGFFFLGLMYNPILSLIAVFIFFGARGEHFMIQQNELLRGHEAKEAMITDITPIKADEQIDRLSSQLISSCDDVFVVYDGDQLKGIVSRNDILQSLKEYSNGHKVGDLARTDFDSIKTSDKLNKIMPKIREKGQSTFPVFEGEDFKGIVSLDSIQRFISLQSSLSY